MVGPLEVTAGATDVSVVVRIMDSTDGTPETAVVFNTSGIDLEYRRDGAASVDITEATLAALTTAHTDGGFLAIGNGYYRLDVPDAAFAVGASGVLIHGTVTGMIVYGPYIKIVPATSISGQFSGTHTSTTSDLGTNAPANDVTGMTLFNATDGESRIITAYNTSTGVATHAAWDTGVGVSDNEPWVLFPTGPVDSVTIAAIQSGLATSSALATVDGLIDQILAAVITNAAGTDIAADIAALKAVADAILVDTGTTIPGTITTVDTVVDAIKLVTDQLVAAQSEPTAVPAANATPLQKLAWIAMLARNKITNSGSSQAVRNDADDADVGTATVGESAGVVTRGEWTDAA